MSESWIGKKVSFENETGDAGCTGVITQEDGDKVFVDGLDEIKGWMPKSELEVND